MIVVLGLIGDGWLNGGDYGLFVYLMIIVILVDMYML